MTTQEVEQLSLIAKDVSYLRERIDLNDALLTKHADQLDDLRLRVAHIGSWLKNELGSDSTTGNINRHLHEIRENVAIIHHDLVGDNGPGLKERLRTAERFIKGLVATSLLIVGAIIKQLIEKYIN